MIKKPLDKIKDDDTREALDFIQEEVQGNPLELSAAPTATAPLLENFETGIYNNVLYLRKGSTILVFTPGSTITIT